MVHNHSHAHHTHTHSEGTEAASKNIVTAFILNLSFAVVELAGGLLTNSIAILSDALHDFGDSVSLGVAWSLQKKSEQKRDSKFSYGYKRFSLLGSVFLSGVLLVSSIFIITEAVRRIFSPQSVHAEGMLWLSIAGIVINGAAVLRLKKGKTFNERAVFLHMMEDVLGWAAVFIASIVMIYVDIPILDPILSLCITVWVLWNVWRNLQGTFKILLQGIPEDIDTKALTYEIVGVEGVGSVHDLHVWSQDGITHVMTLHAVIDAPRESLEGIKEAIRMIGHRHKIDHVTIEFDSVDETDCEYASEQK